MTFPFKESWQKKVWIRTLDKNTEGVFSDIYGEGPFRIDVFSIS